MNGTAHRLGATIALAAAGVATAETPDAKLPRAAIAGIGGYCCGTLPDLLEPATNPHHRQFFHSLAFAVLLGYGTYKLYQWQPESSAGELVRVLGLLAGGAYLTHLALDATTKRSLPLVGRLT
jgi:inner membrane protein